MTMDTQFIVFTDLDGTLLDSNNYSYEPAIPGIKRLKDEKIPLIPVTSKTLSEVQVLLYVLKLRSPIVVENGALIAFPKGYFAKYEEAAIDLESDGDMNILRFGLQYSNIRDILMRIRAAHSFDFLGFGDMSTAQISQASGLSLNKASQAKVRTGSEPIIWNDSEHALELFQNELKLNALKLTSGGRFRTVVGDNDKGQAVQQLTQLYQKKYGNNLATIGLGDSLNDESMFSVVNTPVVVRQADGSVADFGEQHFYLTKGIGPVGWNEFIQLFLDRN